MSNRRAIVDRAVRAIYNDLHDRKGIGNELDAVKDEWPDTYAAILGVARRAIIDAIEDAISEEVA